jgi:hypothetical protein
MAVNILLSFAFHADTDLTAVRANLVCGNLMIDSGAFTAWSKGKPVKLGDYAAYLERYRGCWDHAITLDVIGDGKASAVNTRRLHERGLPVMPVFTRGDKLADFDAMVREVGYVCVGGLVGLPAAAQRQRVGMLQRRAADAGGGVHALGIGSMATLRATRPYSADASNISGAFRFGSIVYFNGRDIVSTQVGDRARLLRDRAHLLDHGIDLALLGRTGRMPGRAEGRGALMQAMSLAYACADEQLKRTGPVTPPREGAAPGPHLYNSVIGQGGGKQVTDVAWTAALDRRLHPGPHLYNSITPEFGLEPAAGLDRELHAATDGAIPPLWRKHGSRHTCFRRTSPHAHST